LVGSTACVGPRICESSGRQGLLPMHTQARSGTHRYWRKAKRLFAPLKWGGLAQRKRSPAYFGRGFLGRPGRPGTGNNSIGNSSSRSPDRLSSKGTSTTSVRDLPLASAQSDTSLCILIAFANMTLGLNLPSLAAFLQSTYAPNKWYTVRYFLRRACNFDLFSRASAHLSINKFIERSHDAVDISCSMLDTTAFVRVPTKMPSCTRSSYSL